MGGQLIPNPIMQWFGDNGEPLTNGTVYTFAAGTTTPIASYADYALTVSNGTSVRLDAYGKATLYLSPRLYLIDVKDANGVSIDGYPRDNVPGIVSAGGAISVKDYGAIGNGTTDDTAAINAAYAVAKAALLPLQFPAGTYKITSTLTWNGMIPVYGAGMFTSIIKKFGNFVGIAISGDGCQTEYANFQLNSNGAPDAADGIDITGPGADMSMRNIYVTNQGASGITINCLATATLINVGCVTNGFHGLLINPGGAQFVSANQFIGLDVRANTGDGLVLFDGGLHAFGNTFTGVTAQNNTQYGVVSRCSLPNYFEVYSEQNTTGNILLDTPSKRQCVYLLNADADPGVVDVGTDGSNVWFDFSNGRYCMPYLSGQIPGSNVAGRSFSISGSNAGAGAAGHKGGDCAVQGGDAKGTAGAANGGNVTIIGGAGINTGIEGEVNVSSATGKLAFHGVTAITRAVLATGAAHTVDDVITALQNLGLVKQS